MPLSTRELLLAYTAGFFDGEGCIQITTQTSGYLRLSLQLAQKSRVPLDYIQQGLGGKIFEVSWKKSDGYTLNWYNLEAGRVLQEIEPYLVLKRPQALLALEFINLAPGQGKIPRPEIKQRRSELAAEIRLLKEVG